jgi:hypothetical protein
VTYFKILFWQSYPEAGGTHEESQQIYLVKFRTWYVYKLSLHQRARCLRIEPGPPMTTNTRLVNFLKKQEVLGRINRLLFLIRQGPHWKRRVQQFFYCCVCISYRGKVSTEPLPSNNKGNFTEPSSYLATRGGYTYRDTDWGEGFFN